MTSVLFRKTLRDFWRRKGSLAALIAIVTVGIGCFVGFASLYRDLDGARLRYYRDYRLADFAVDLKRAPDRVVESCADLPNVRGIRGRIVAAVRIDLPDVDEPISGSAISMPARREPVLNDLLMRSGTWFTGPRQDEVILNEAFAAAHGLRPGDRVKILLLDRLHDLLVIGTAQSPEFVYLIPGNAGFVPDPARFGAIYLPEEFLAESMDLEGAYNQLIGMAHNASPRALRETLDRLEDRLDPYGVVGSTALADTASVRFLNDELEGLKVSARILPGIFLGVAALILNVLMGRLVAQQRSVIGTLRAIGYSRLSITRHFLGYGILIGMLGGVLGVAFGRWIETAMLNIYKDFFALPEMIPSVYPDLLLGGICVSLLCACLGTLKGLKAAFRLDPAEAMRPPPPERGGRVLPERIPFLWSTLSFRGKMILRTIFRNPFRGAVSVLAAAISTALVLTALANVDALDELVSFQFEEIAHEDFSIALRDPVAAEARSEIGAFRSVSGAEIELAVPCDLRNGPYEKRLGATGIARGNFLHTPVDREGNKIPIPETGLVISRKLGEILHIGAGDVLRFRPLIGERREVRAPVVALVDTYLGLSVYADLDYLSGLLGERRAANRVLATRYAGNEPSPFLSFLERRPAVVGIGERQRSMDLIDKTMGESMGASIAIMVLFSGLIAFGSVLNATLASVSERKREVGTFRVLGYTPAQVASIFSGESLALNGVGIGLGLFGGIGLVRLIAKAYSTELFRFPVVIYPQKLLYSALLMVAFIGLAQAIVYRIIRSLDWLEVLKVRE